MTFDEILKKIIYEGKLGVYDSRKFHLDNHIRVNIACPYIIIQ